MKPIIEQVIRGYMEAKGVQLPADPRFTLATVDPAGRVDVAASAALQRLAADNPITDALFSVFRPLIDGQLTQQLGPARIAPMVEQLPPEVQGALVRFKR